MSIEFRRRLCSLIPVAVFAGLLACSAGDAGAGERCQSCEAQVVWQIQRYCAVSWQNTNIPRAEWADCSQQVFTELLQRIPRSDLANAIHCARSEQRRELNRSIWRIAKRWARRVRHPSLAGFDAADPATMQGHQLTADRLQEVAQIAAEKLTPRQSSILSLLCDGHSIGQISERLEIPTSRVSDEKYRAIQKIRRHLSLA